MRIFAIGDLHLPGREGKVMDIFGEHWRDHGSRIAADWDARVGADDVVLVPGDISWGMSLATAADDLAWLGDRPGHVVITRGNHDYWWQSISKVRGALADHVHAIQNDAWTSPDGTLTVAGTRLWDVPGLRLGDIFEPRADGEPLTSRPADDERLFARELGRLERSLDAMSPDAQHRVAMVHYPPTTPDGSPTPVTELLARYRVDVCVFGHLHTVRAGVTFAPTRDGVRYLLTSADHLGFELLEITL